MIAIPISAFKYDFNFLQTLLFSVIGGIVGVLLFSILSNKINVKDIKDSKKIPFRKRLLLSKYIKKNSIYAVGTASVEEINKINILNASLLSMKRALDKLKLKPSIIYIDGLFAPKDLKIKYKTFVKGDEKITCISAASIVAKATRDVFMIQLGKKFPKYKWNKNFGYGTKEHLNGIRKYGITKHHRKNFKPIHNILMSKTRETL